MLESISTPEELDREARYRLSGEFAYVLDLVGIGLHGRRLALGLAHATCRETADWHHETAVQPAEGYRVRCRVLRERLGLEGANGNRDLMKGLEELLAARMLDRGEFVCGRQWLHWRFTDHMFARLFAAMPYGLFDVRHARHLGSILDHFLYNRIGVIRQRRAPSMTLPVDGSAFVAKRDADWSRFRPALLASLVRVAGLFDLKLLVICECHGQRIGIDHFTLKVMHRNATWKTSYLRKFPATARKAYILDGKGWTERQLGG